MRTLYNMVIDKTAQGRRTFTPREDTGAGGVLTRFRLSARTDAAAGRDEADDLSCGTPNGAGDVPKKPHRPRRVIHATVRVRRRDGEAGCRNVRARLRGDGRCTAVTYFRAERVFIHDRESHPRLPLQPSEHRVNT